MNQTQAQKSNVDSKGNLQSYMSATPIGMTCEHKNCNNKNGRDYKRINPEEGWEDEPIFLCEEHSKGFELLNLK